MSKHHLYRRFSIKKAAIPLAVLEVVTLQLAGAASANLAGGTFEGVEALATAAAFTSPGLTRRDALWAAGAAAANRPGQLAATPRVGQPLVPITTTPEEMAADATADARAARQSRCAAHNSRPAT